MLYLQLSYSITILEKLFHYLIHFCEREQFVSKRVGGCDTYIYIFIMLYMYALFMYVIDLVL